MRNGKIWPVLLIPVLLTGLTAFSSCGTTGKKASLETARAIQEYEDTLKALVPPLPEKPGTEPVRFEDRDGGLWLSYDDYRALERNVIALREYAERLKIVVEFYREER